MEADDDSAYNCVVEDNSGIGIVGGDGRPTVLIRNCRSARNNGGGISMAGGCIDKCTVVSNFSHGISMPAEYANVCLTNCTITGNTGDGINAPKGNACLAGCQITGNGGHGIYMPNATNAYVANCTIVSNTGYGVIIKQSASVCVTNSTMTANRGEGVVTIKENLRLLR